MRVISSIDFHNNTEKYLDIAEREQVFIDRGNKGTYLLEKRDCLCPDKDLERAIGVEDFRAAAKNHIQSLYAKNK